VTEKLKLRFSSLDFCLIFDISLDYQKAIFSLTCFLSSHYVYVQLLVNDFYLLDFDVFKEACFSNTCEFYISLKMFYCLFTFDFVELLVFMIFIGLSCMLKCASSKIAQVFLAAC
jgi:hypothetical protein